MTDEDDSTRGGAQYDSTSCTTRDTGKSEAGIGRRRVDSRDMRLRPALRAIIRGVIKVPAR